MSTSNGRKAPSGLGPAGKKDWHQAHAEREFVCFHDTRRLAMLCRLQDEIAADEETLRAEGRYTTDRHGRRIPHPALRTLGENRILYLRCVRELGLDLETPEDPRIPRRY